VFYGFSFLGKNFLAWPSNSIFVFRPFGFLEPFGFGIPGVGWGYLGYFGGGAWVVGGRIYILYKGPGRLC